jgi:hypothetical protein
MTKRRNERGDKVRAVRSLTELRPDALAVVSGGGKMTSGSSKPW